MNEEYLQLECSFNRSFIPMPEGSIMIRMVHGGCPMSLFSAARSVLLDRGHVSIDVGAAYEAFVDRDVLQNSDVLEQRMGPGADLSERGIERIHRDVVNEMVPSGMGAFRQSDSDRMAGVVAARLYGVDDAELAHRLRDVHGIDGSAPPSEVMQRAHWIRIRVLQAAREGSFDLRAGVPERPVVLDVGADRDAHDRARIEVRFGRAMADLHPDSFARRHVRIKVVDVGEGSVIGRDRSVVASVRREAWRREVSIARGRDPGTMPYDVARGEYSRMVMPDLDPKVPSSIGHGSEAIPSDRRADPILNDPRSVAWSVLTRDRLQDEPALAMRREGERALRSAPGVTGSRGPVRGRPEVSMEFPVARDVPSR